MRFFRRNKDAKPKEPHHHVKVEDDICNKHGDKTGLFRGKNHKFTNRNW